MAEGNSHESTGALAFEDVWTMFKETDREFKEMSRETDLKFRETDLKFKETDLKFRETDRALKEASRIVGNLGNKLGIVVEHLVLANIKEKFNDLGYEFTKMGPNVLIDDKKQQFITQIDAMLENGEFAIAIEVKTQLNVGHVDEHLERMEKLRLYADNRHDTRKFLGAVAGAIVADNVKTYALKKGLYVIRQSGDMVTIENPSGFKPREW
ncbi:MAG: hypothetical protein LBQ38_11860 [Spirochaetaceae bacterium]|jgi:hypothetical protein|nr:hypothetical protein [Spirochaetaceae bacterium]